MNIIPVAYAAEVAELTKIKQYILNPIIVLLFGLAILYFLFGVVKFISSLDSKEGKEEGKKHLLWGIVGLAIMVSVYGLMNFITATIQEIAN